MPTLDEIKQQANKLDGVSKFLGRKEINELPSLLWEDEKVENLAQGTYQNGNGLLVATNKRLIFINKGLLWGIKVEDFPYDKVSTIQYSTGIIYGKITIYTMGNKSEIDNVIKSKAREFCDYVRARITKAIDHASANNINDKADIVTQLKELASLKEQGILTEEEFAIQKHKLLS